MNTELTQLSPKKRKFVHYLKFFNDNKPKLSEIRKEIGISKTTFYRWLKDKNLLIIVEEQYIVGADLSARRNKGWINPPLRLQKEEIIIADESYIVGAQCTVPLIKESIYKVHNVLRENAVQGDVSAE